MTEVYGQQERQQEATQTAALSRRFIAYLVDWYVGALATALPVSIVSMRLFQTMTNQNIMSFDPPYQLIAGALGVLCALLYYVAVPLFVWRGQTMGKRWLKLKIVAKDGSEATTGMLVLRQVVGIIIVEGSLVTASTLWHQMATIVTGVDFVNILKYVGIGVSIVSAIMVLFKNHRAIHDFIGGTTVVSCKNFPKI